MQARILTFKAAPPTPISTRLKSLENSGSILIEIPAELAQRITDAAIYVPKSAEQFALDILAEAFPEKTGAA